MVVLVAAQFCRFVNKEECLLCLNQRSSFDQGNGVYWANNVPPLRQRSCPRRLIWFYIFRARVTLWLWLTFYGCIKDTGQQEQQKMGLLTNAVKQFKHCRWDKNPFCRRKLFGSLAIYLDVNISCHCLVTFHCLPGPDLRIKQLLSPSGDLGISLVWRNLSPPHRSFLVWLLKSSSNWTK